MSGRIDIKAGAKLTLEAALRHPNGTLMADAEAGWISAQVRDARDGLVGELAWTIVSPGVARGTAETAGWAAGPHQCDIRVGRPDGTVISETFQVRVHAAVTR